MFSLQNQTAFISGASRGLGEQFALTLAKAGADLILTSRDVSALTKIKQQVEYYFPLLYFPKPLDLVFILH